VSPEQRPAARGSGILLMRDKANLFDIFLIEWE
jgi:hypothetical protein